MVVKNEEVIKKKFNVFLNVLMVLLCLIGFILIASATNIIEAHNYKLLISQVIWFFLGLVLFLIFSYIDYRLLSSFYIVIYITMLGLLLYVDFKGINVLGGHIKCLCYFFYAAFY